MCCDYSGDFRNLHETPELQRDENLLETIDLLVVDIILCNPLYNVRRQQDHYNSDYDVFNTKYTDRCCNFAEKFLIHRGHGHILCSPVQAASWWWRFCIGTEEVEDDIAEMKVFEAE